MSETTHYLNLLIPLIPDSSVRFVQNMLFIFRKVSKFKVNEVYNNLKYARTAIQIQGEDIIKKRKGVPRLKLKTFILYFGVLL